MPPWNDAGGRLKQLDLSSSYRAGASLFVPMTI